MISVIGIDTTNLHRAVQLAAEYNQRTPTLMVATAGFFVARAVSRDVHRASISDIDSKLGLTAEPIISSRGKRKGLPLKSGKKNLIATDQGTVTVAERIILARFWPGSPYNVKTNQRWAIDRTSFSPGQGALGFILAVHIRSLSMANRRHQSVAMLASSAVPIIKDFEKSVAPKYRRGSGTTDLEGIQHTMGLYKNRIGDGTVTATENTATAEGDFNVGLFPSLISQQENDASWKWLAPALQKAVNDEADKNMRYVAQEEMKSRAPQFASYGAIVTTSSS